MTTHTLRLSQKGQDFIEWDEYFMAIAGLVSKRSKDPCTQVGACIVNSKNRIVGQGYNGMPRGCDDDEFPWDKRSNNRMETKYFYVCHAEMNAIFNKNCADISGCRIYTVLFPCNQCAKTIIQSGITEVIYMCDKNRNQPEAQAAKMMLDAASVKCRQFLPSCEGFTINFKTGICQKSSSASLVASPDRNRSSPIGPSKKRENCLPWQDYFTAIAILVAKRSKSPEFQLGACIVNQNNSIIGQGYNGMPNGCSDDVFPWGTDGDDPLKNKHLFECHAELNAILNAGLQTEGCTMYTIAFPCNECAKAIIQSRISKVIHVLPQESSQEIEAAKKMFDAAGVLYRQFHIKQEEIFVHLLEIYWDRATQLPPTPIKMAKLS